MYYILLVMDHFNVKYPYGYTLHLASKRRYIFNITVNLRSKVQKCFSEIKSYMNSKNIPKRQNNGISCRNYSYCDFCWFE